jgi:hypothetical protein
MPINEKYLRAPDSAIDPATGTAIDPSIDTAVAVSA